MSATPTSRTAILSPEKASSQAQIRLGLLVLLLAAVTVYAAIQFTGALSWSRLPFPGFMLNHTMQVTQASPNGSKDWPGLAAGIEAGDKLVYIDGQIINSSDDYISVLEQFESGDRVLIGFTKAESSENTDDLVESGICTPVEGGSPTCSLELSLIDLPESDFIALFVTPFVSGIVVLLIGMTLLWLRPRDTDAFLVVLASALLAVFMIGLYDMATTHQYIPIWLAATCLLGGVAITFAMVFPAPIPAIVRNPSRQYGPPILGIILTMIAIGIFSSETPANANEAAQLAGVAMIVGVSIMAALLFFYQRPFAPSIMAHQNANTIFVTLMLALTPGILWIVSLVLRLIFDTPPLSLPIELTMPFVTLPAFGMFIAITQTRRYDSDRVVSTGLTYGVMLLALIIGYFLLVAGASLLTTDTIETDNPLFIVLTVFFMSLLFIPVRTQMQDRIDRIYFRKRTDYQNKLEEFSQKLTSLAGIDVMIEEFHALLSETVQPGKILIFLKDPQTGDFNAYAHPHRETDVVFGTNSGVAELLQNRDTMVYLQPGSPWPPELIIDRQRLEILRVMLIGGLPGSNSLNGFVCLTPPKSGSNSYSFEELRFINNLVGQLAIAVERAQVITSLERRVNELNVLSQVGQAVNFTIEVNDLLELISVQTMRLIPSPFFYIALIEPATNQLYFAFFLEDDIRDQNKEGKKWPLGKDLFSEVIMKSQARRIDDYALIMRQNNYRFGYENPETKAWMGVPLISGPSTLGVLAIGESDPNKKYTPEQLRIFGDIGALAATSIEKANLFTNANIRARQLSVLNDISRQLVEIEGDLDALLDLITESAVEILGAEAGSLLLTLDDGRLRFTASVGGTGDQLLGTTLPAGHGLVGQVAQTGEAVISNDASADERWQGEVIDNGFSTDSILAVPLVAKGNVVGVLEVINKKDGSIYVSDDVELLSAFASQAAIAYENARLRQQTGVQLEKRVKELESLERIDRELNQTLEINSVAEITVRWAIANSNATTGLLGIVTDDRSQLRILAKSGYSERDTPDGAVDTLWPLTKGIVARVMRTRRADLQPDVAIDPNYIPSLRSSLSQITVPMISGDDINAILVLETDREPRLNLLDLDWVQRLAEHASIAIANAQLYAELTRANETKSEFVAFAAHELKNPLTSVMGWAASLRGSMIDNMNIEQIRNVAGVIHTNADRMENIINDLRDIAASDANKLQIDPEPTKLRQIVADTLLPYEKQIQDKGQTVINQVDEDLPAVMVDPKRLIQVMTNFVSNAHKYSPEDSTITILAQVVDRYVNQQGRNMGQMMKVGISDTGIGMSPEDLKRIFREDYFRSDNELAQAQKGTGLGMMITKRIIEGHNGEVWVESKLGEGSTFFFVLPLAPQPEPTKEEQREPEGASD